MIEPDFQYARVTKRIVVWNDGSAQIIFINSGDVVRVQLPVIDNIAWILFEGQEYPVSFTYLLAFSEMCKDLTTLEKVIYGI
jgi:hypothetical protein